MSTLSQQILSQPSMELSFPSELGYEKVAREAVAAFARRLGCDRERVEDLKTALGEACINAIEHGNGRAPGLRVDVSCVGAGDRLEVEVRDRGLNRSEAAAPVATIDLKLSGLAPLRGMGLMMISQLVDEAGFTESSDGGNHFRLVLYFHKS
jgi:serine/threonine-protein kinase RsbW